MSAGTMPSPRMHADEVPIDATLVRRLLAAQFPRWAGLPLAPVLPWGTDNALYRLGDDLAVRLPRRPQTVAQLEKERRWLPVLAPRLPLAIPAPLAAGEPAEGYPLAWGIYRWLDGAPATETPIADHAAAAADLVAFIAALQAIDPTDGPRPGPDNAWRGVPLATRDRSTRASIAALGDAIDARAVTAGWEAALAAPDWSRPHTWLHGDLDARNVLVAGGRLTAVIDFGCMGVGDPTCDFAVAWKLLTPDTRGGFRAALAVDDATWTRARGWVLSQAVNALSYYTIETNAVLVREAHRWIAEALADA
jgi:aminoglycoside phosphotransferase (APT) family kinase protein